MHSHAPGHSHQAGEALSGTAQAFQAILDAHKTLTQFNKAQATAKTPEEKARVKEMASEQIKARKAFDKAVSTYAAGMTNHQSSAYFKTTFEFWYSRFSPFIWTMYIYIGSFLCTAMSWIFWRKPMARAGLWLLGLALFVHTFAIFARVYITGYAPVTNLASSAMWVAWGAAVFALFIELIFRNTLGLFIAAVVGVPSLLIAHYRGLGGDTMAQMEAVLDSNLWLTVHVLTITLGYSATFVAAAVGMAYLIVRLQPSFDPQIDRTYKNIMFGVTCFAMVFSFVGTITGGIWADQSWGRFWGWDPKENGAILVVLANAIFLHARLSGIAKGVGMANIAIASAMVTAWSWFGTNLMGAGLHAYGFFESGWLWLYIAWIEMAQYMLLGLLPAKNIEPPENQLPAPPPVHPGLRPSRYVTKVV